MKPTSLFLGACALACVAGAVGGMTTNTVPINRAGIGTAEFAARPAISDFTVSTAPTVLSPDHYALETPTGRIEVAELANAGLYSQERFGNQRLNEEQPDALQVERVALAEPDTDLPAPLDLSEPAETTSNYARTVDFPTETPTGT